jgi:hypothetical protein
MSIGMTHRAMGAAVVRYGRTLEAFRLQEAVYVAQEAPPITERLFFR